MWTECTEWMFTFFARSVKFIYFSGFFFFVFFTVYRCHRMTYKTQIFKTIYNFWEKVSARWPNFLCFHFQQPVNDPVAPKPREKYITFSDVGGTALVCDLSIDFLRNRLLDGRHEWGSQSISYQPSYPCSCGQLCLWVWWVPFLL